MLKINPNISIFVQLAEHLRIEIFSGALKPGDKILSIREMAVELEVNPNTIKRVYQELSDDGLIVTQGTLGNYVTEDTELIKNKKAFFLIHKTSEFVNLLQAVDADVDQVIKKYKGDNDGKND
ncbi:MAG: GntR family transcriptional regulator [Acholeplasmataceae bacterium]|jgi:DNA-binding transcriptional regulator YhcF (GntR family)|nr:GntR family transcriptional regulator [Acholeplasmataceae bacterium]